MNTVKRPDAIEVIIEKLWDAEQAMRDAQELNRKAKEDAVLYCVENQLFEALTVNKNILKRYTQRS